MANETLTGIDRFFYQEETGSSSEVENKIIIPFSQVFRYIEGIGNSISAYTLENFYKHTLDMFKEPMYIYYGDIDPYQNTNINVWIDTTEEIISNEENQTEDLENNENNDDLDGDINTEPSE